MKYLKIILGILISIIIIGLIISVIIFLINKIEKEKIIKENNELISELSKKLEDRDNKIKNLKPIKEIKYLNYDEKNGLIIKQREIIDNDTIIIADLKEQLEKSTDIIDNKTRLKNSLSAIGLIGIDQNLSLDIYTGIMYKRLFLNGRIYLGVGCTAKIYKTFGGGAVLEVGFSF